MSDDYGLSVLYRNESWKTKGLTIRLSLFGLLKSSNPEKKVIIVKDGRQDLRVPISELELS